MSVTSNTKSSEFISDERQPSDTAFISDSQSDTLMQEQTSALSTISFPSNPTVHSVLESLPLQDRPQLRSVSVSGIKPVELVFIDENPLFKPAERPSGTFGPLPMRSGYDKLFYGTGTAYLLGLSYGGVYGVIRGLQTAQVPNFRVRMNAIINQTTRYGPWAANSLGVMTMTWALLDNLAGLVRGKSDYANHISAAFATGMLFKSTAGLRPAVLTGSVLASVVSTYGAYEWFTTPEKKDLKSKNRPKKTISSPALAPATSA